MSFMERTRKVVIKKDRSIIPMILVALVIAGLASAPFFWAYRLNMLYKAFAKDMHREFMQGERFDTIEAFYDGEQYHLKAEYASRIFRTLNISGMGRKCDPIEAEFSESVLVDLNNEAKLFLAPTRMVIEYDEEVSGLYVEYTYSDGKKYCYETDDIQFYHIRQIMKDVIADND